MTTILTCFLAGVVYSDFDVSAQKLKRGQKLLLVAEPNNDFDAHAIQVKWKNQHIGYIPAISTYILHGYRKAGTPLRCVVKQFAATNPTHRMILVDIIAKNEKRSQIINF